MSDMFRCSFSLVAGSFEFRLFPTVGTLNDWPPPGDPNEFIAQTKIKAETECHLHHHLFNPFHILLFHIFGPHNSMASTTSPVNTKPSFLSNLWRAITNTWLDRPKEAIISSTSQVNPIIEAELNFVIYFFSLKFLNPVASAISLLGSYQHLQCRPTASPTRVSNSPNSLR